MSLPMRRLSGLLATVVFCALATVAAASGDQAERSVPTVSYVAPTGKLSGPVILRAEASSRAGRIVAVTFFPDGRPLGSDTTEPYALDIDAGLLPAGRHRIRVEAVDQLARRFRTPPIEVTMGTRTGRMLTASPRRGLSRALSALRRGD